MNPYGMNPYGTYPLGNMEGLLGGYAPVLLQQQQQWAPPYLQIGINVCKHGSNCPMCTEDRKREKEAEAELARIELQRKAEYKERTVTFMKHYREKYPYKKEEPA